MRLELLPTSEGMKTPDGVGGISVETMTDATVIMSPASWLTDGTTDRPKLTVDRHASGRSKRTDRSVKSQTTGLNKLSTILCN